MKKILGFLIFACNLNESVNAQLCPGGGTAFANAVLFDQSWTSACSSGTSCTGGIILDNRVACEPTTAMDACAPGPSCTVNAQDGSDIWFQFYATGTTATLNLIQSVSFVATLQAFSGGPACGGLTEIGCAKAGGPSSGVTLNLTGLTLGQLYYFRVFGSASAASQRTGTYCFCGSAGLGSTVLPVVLSSFKAIAQNGKTLLNWITGSETNSRWFEIERSMDGSNYETIGKINAKGTTTSKTNYTFSDLTPFTGINFYRLKLVDLDNRFEYSSVVSAKIDFPVSLHIFPVPAANNLFVESATNNPIRIFNTPGYLIKTIAIKKGRNKIDISDLPAGFYFIRQSNIGNAIKFQVIH